jgi:hypothetical protein
MRALKVLVLVCGIFLLALGSVLLALRYSFPSEEVRQRIEQMLSRQLQGTAHVATLEWDWLSGIRLGTVEIERDGKRLAQVDGLTLRYSLHHLLRGTLLINELVLTGADAVVDLRDLPTGPSVEPAAESPSPTTLPALPLTIKVESLRVQDSQLAVTGHGGFRLLLHDVNLAAGFGIGPKGANMAGGLDIATIEVAWDGHQWQLPLHVEFGVAADRSEGRLTVERLDLQSKPLLRLSMKGGFDPSASLKDVAMSVQDGEINLEPLLSLGRPFLPPHLADVHVAGTITPQMTIKGNQTDQGFDGIVEVTFSGQGIRGTVPSFHVTLEPTTFSLHTGEIPVRSNRPGAVHGNLSAHTTVLTDGATSLRNLDLGVQVARADSGQFSAHLTATADLSTSLPPAIQLSDEPVRMEMDMSGDEITQAFSLERMAAQVGTWLEIQAGGEVGPAEQAAGEHPFTAHTVIEADVTKLLPASPDAALRGVVLTSKSSRQKIRFNLSGALDAEFRPRHADMAAEFNMSGLHAISTTPDIEGTVDRAAVEIRATYDAQAGSLKGTLAGMIGLEELKHTASLALASADLKFRSEFDGRIVRETTWHRLVAASHVDLETRRIRYTGHEMNGQLDRLRVSASTKVDLLEGLYRLDSLHMVAGSLLDVTVKGKWRSENRQFSWDVSMPSFNVGELPNHVSGLMAQSLMEIKPTGRLSLRAHGIGTVPRREEVAALRIPMTVHINLDLHDVAAAFGDHAVAGATGTIRISSEPQPRGRTMASGQLRTKHLNVGGGVPLKPLNWLTVDLAASAEEFDNLSLERFIVRTDGAEATLDGEISGVKHLLTSRDQPLLALVGPLFTKLHGNAHFDLDRLGEVLRPHGITGSGHVGISLNLLKKERGPLDVRLQVLPQQLSLTKDGYQVHELDGAVDIRKVLQWMPEPDGIRAPVPFSPTGVLPDLRISTAARHDLRIRLLDIGTLPVRDLSTGLFFDRNRIVLQDLAMTVLGGYIGGEVIIGGGKVSSLATRLEATKLDLNQLLPPGERVKGDSLVDGTLTLTAVFEAEQGRLDFGRSKLDVALTRIGRDALERVLRFLDPTGSNPAIAGARSAVKLANPSAVRIILSKGLVGLQIQFQEGVVGRFELDRIPVSQIKQVRDLARAVPLWDTIRSMMQALGAERYGVDRAGAFVLE